MIQRFPIALALAHLPLILVSAWILTRWRVRVARPSSWLRWCLFLTSDAVLLVTALLIGAVALGVSGHVGFATMRLGAQALFGETLLLIAGMSALHLARPRNEGAAPRARGALLGAIALLLLAAYVEAYHRCPYDLQVRRHSVQLGSGDNGSLRLLHLTDLQTHAIRDYERRVLRTAADLHPDLIVFTGDYLQSRHRPTRRQATGDFRELLRETRFAPKYGGFAVQGDCEGNDWRDIFDGLDFTCLDNETRRLKLDGGQTLDITGLDLPMSRRTVASKLAPVARKKPGADYHLVIGHSPDFVRDLRPDAEVDLALAGHTHGGQIVIPGFGPPITFSKLPRRYAGDLHLFGEIPLHVSRGIGMERGHAPQIRLFCPPEICLIEIRY